MIVVTAAGGLTGTAVLTAPRHWVRVPAGADALYLVRPRPGEDP